MHQRAPHKYPGGRGRLWIAAGVGELLVGAGSTYATYLALISLSVGGSFTIDGWLAIVNAVLWTAGGCHTLFHWRELSDQPHIR